MSDIATRAEQAKPEETRGLLGDLYAAIYQKQQGWASPVNLDQFNARLDCEAYVDAAMMLVPEGYRMHLDYWDTPNLQVSTAILRVWRAEPATLAVSGSAATPALALIAAISRSVE